MTVLVLFFGGTNSGVELGGGFLEAFEGCGGQKLARVMGVRGEKSCIAGLNARQITALQLPFHRACEVEGLQPRYTFAFLRKATTTTWKSGNAAVVAAAAVGGGVRVSLQCM